jgi:hypothetical protein
LIKYNPKEPIEDCGYIAVFWRIRGEKNNRWCKQKMVTMKMFSVSGTTFYENWWFFLFNQKKKCVSYYHKKWNICHAILYIYFISLNICFFYDFF